MATGGVSLKNTFECAVCLNDMLDRTPRSLTCLHTFCEECLEPLIKKNEIICPSCRKPTQVNDNSVKQLPVNFHLCQMKELLKSDKYVTQSRKSKKLCEICKKGTASYKCEDCPRIFCKPCKEGHSTMKKYEVHVAYVLCMAHNEAIKHFCMECYVGLCAECKVEHVVHEGKIEDYNKSTDKLWGELEKMNQNLAITASLYDKNFGHVIKKSNMNKELLKDLKERKVYHEQKVQELCELIKITEENQTAFEELELEYEQNRFHCEEIKHSIENVSGNVSKFKKIPALRQKTEEMNESLQRDLDAEYHLPPFTLCEQIPVKLTLPRQTKQFKNLKKSELLFTVEKKDNAGYNGPMVLLEGNILAVSKKEPSIVIMIDDKGKVTAQYHPKIKGEKVTDVDVHNNKIYLLQKQGISVLTSKQQLIKFYEPKIEAMNKLLVVNEDIILISDYKENGHIYCCNVNNSDGVKFKTVIQGLNKPSYLHMTDTKDGRKYIITEDWAHCVKVYSESWKLLNTIGIPGTKSDINGVLSYPNDTAITDQNTILVADWNNNRVCHFTLEGKFLSNVLTAQDGIFNVTGILYRNGLLWLCEFTTSADIKCFKLEYTE